MSGHSGTLRTRTDGLEPSGKGAPTVGQAWTLRGRDSGQDIGQDWLGIVVEVTTSAETEHAGASAAGAGVDAAIAADTCAFGSAGASRLSDDQLRAWVARSCAEQGVPLHVTDVLVLERVRVLLTGTAAPGQPPAVRPVLAGSETPHRPHPVRVQDAGAQDTGADDGVVEHRADDRGLSGQVQLVPRSA